VNSQHARCKYWSFSYTWHFQWNEISYELPKSVVINRDSRNRWSGEFTAVSIRRSLVVLWSYDTSTISGWSPRAPTMPQSIPNSLKQLSGEIPSVSVWFGHRSPRRRATETVDRASSPSTPRSTDTDGPAAAVDVDRGLRRRIGNDRRDVESLSDTAVPANSSRRTCLPSCRPDLHTAQQLKRVPWMSISNSQPYYKFQFYRLRDQWNAPSLLSIIPRTFTVIYLRP